MDSSTRRYIDDTVSSRAGRSGQEAKRRRAGRIRKLDVDIDRFIKGLEKKAMISVPPHARKKGRKPKLRRAKLEDT